jgi:hypothetical protein
MVTGIGQPGGKGWVRLSPRGVQEGQEVDPAQSPVRTRNVAGQMVGLPSEPVRRSGGRELRGQVTVHSGSLPG